MSHTCGPWSKMSLDIKEYDTENHTEKFNQTEKPLKPHLQKIITLKFALQ